MFARRSLFASAALAVLCSSAGCRFFRPVDPNKPSQPAAKADAPAKTGSQASAKEPASRPVPKGSISDANIAAMVLASNNTDISYARLVPSRAQRVDVKKFAERMLTDHTGVNTLVTNLLTKL